MALSLEIFENPVQNICPSGPLGAGVEVFVTASKEKICMECPLPIFNTTMTTVDARVIGQIEGRFTISYRTDGTDVLDAVDCWVLFIEDFEMSLLKCL